MYIVPKSTNESRAHFCPEPTLGALSTESKASAIQNVVHTLSVSDQLAMDEATLFSVPDVWSVSQAAFTFMTGH